MVEPKKQAPLGSMPDNFGEGILNEIESGSIHPIVISPDFVVKHGLFADRYDKLLNRYRNTSEVPFEIPMPFDSVWVEFLPDQIGMNPMLACALPQYGLYDSQQIFGYLLRKSTIQEETAYSITAFVVVQNQRGVREVCTVTDTIKKSEYVSQISGRIGEVRFYGSLWHHQLFDILNRMCSERQVGLDKTKIQVRAGKGRLRRLIKVKNIVYVIPASERASFNQNHGTAVDWTHRWEVRGHWRKVPNVGKDPDGNYCIPGMTWVRPSIKGPEKAPLVQKTRLAFPAKESPGPG